LENKLFNLFKEANISEAVFLQIFDLFFEVGSAKVQPAIKLRSNTINRI